ncbi:MAG: RloB domain-containing protein [candidate division Zixibacteria bacterium]|nr:RloB domain-containing protein [candidate division Zixibacteria bacterium]
MPAKRVFKPRLRRSNVRDARLIVIATEGNHTEPKYFKDMASPEYYRNSRIHVEILDRLTTDSAPEHVMNMLDQFKREFRLNKYDELWMVIDVDRWGKKKLSSIAAQCLQKNYSLAVSNPCFELWLLLHLKSLADYTPVELAEFVENKKENHRTRLEKELVKLLGSFSKKNPDMTRFLPYVKTAIDRARKLDTSPEHRWPNSLGSRVYLLAEKIILITYTPRVCQVHPEINFRAIEQRPINWAKSLRDNPIYRVLFCSTATSSP